VHFEKGVMGMMGHDDKCPKQWVDSITDAAKLVMPLLPKEARLSNREFVKVGNAAMLVFFLSAHTLDA
jgi:hypothetical protein